MSRIVRMLLLVVAVTLALPSCAGSVRQFIVEERSRQGDRAYDNNNLDDAALAYRLALQLAPQDVHARAGLAAVQLRIADQLFRKSKFDEARAALAVAAKYDPGSVRLAALKSEIEEARVKREIVVSNYPTYRETGRQLRRSFLQLKTQSAAIVSALQRFDYTYDSAELSKAITASSELNADVSKLTNRLANYRQLVESGSPERAAEAPLAPAASLLPLP